MVSIYRVDDDSQTCVLDSGLLVSSNLMKLLTLCIYETLEEEMTTHSSILAWRIPWAEEPDGLQSMGRRESATTERLTLIHLFILSPYLWARMKAL